MLHLCPRGREHLRKMNKSTFLIGTNAKGLEYFCQKQDELDKNHRQDDMHNSISEGRMYAIPGKKFQLLENFKNTWSLQLQDEEQQSKCGSFVYMFHVYIVYVGFCLLYIYTVSFYFTSKPSNNYKTDRHTSTNMIHVNHYTKIIKLIPKYHCNVVFDFYGWTCLHLYMYILAILWNT